MQWTDKIRQVKIALVLVAVVIAVASLWVSHILVSDLSEEEKNKMEVWVQAWHTMNTADENTDLSLALRVIQGNNTIPVIVMDANDEVLDYRNVEISAANAEDSAAYVKKEGMRMLRSGRYIRLDMDDSGNSITDYQLVCYDESLMLRRLASYPYVRLGIVLIFLVLAIFALLCST